MLRSDGNGSAKISNKRLNSTVKYANVKTRGVKKRPAVAERFWCSAGRVQKDIEYCAPSSQMSPEYSPVTVPRPSAVWLLLIWLSRM